MKKAIDRIKNFRITRRVFAYPYILFLVLFVVVPLAMISVNAFIAGGKITLTNFAEFFGSATGLRVLGDSILIGLITCAICLLLGYPVAYILNKYSSSKILVLLFILPMWVNFLLRTLATKSLFLMLGLPLGLGSVLFGMVYNYLPFMILPIHTTLSGLGKEYAEAAADLGADNITVILKTILPLSLPGIISGITMVFIPTISTYAISQLLSNGTIYLFGDSINTKFANGLYGVGSVMSLIMLVLVVISNIFISKYNKGNSGRTLW
ncbi:MAG: ABC transporter permease [Clostridiales bacterium]|nr:ABC transporter permease [Clostridiales bacterium]HOB65039.1 ABC transporter permease [Clostridia bacterium]